MAVLPYFTFSDDEMLAYLDRLNPHALKYQLDVSDPKDSLLGEKLRLLQRINLFEETFEPSGIRDDDADKTHKMLEMIYGDAEPIDQLVEIVHLVRRKLITGLVSVEGLALLFNCKYFTYEWLLHTEIDDRKQERSGSYYRDHFIHQVKDAYSIVRLLEELPSLTDRLLVDFMDSNANVNAYLNKQTSIMLHNLKDQHEWQDIYLRLAEIRLKEENERYNDKRDSKIDRERPDGALNEVDLNEHLAKVIALMGKGVSVDDIIDKLSQAKTSQENLEKYANYRRIQVCVQKQMKKEILRNIMISSMVIAGLFHDIGYPIRYDLKNREQLAGMIPTAHFFIESIDHFTQIKGLLSNTLLFRTVDLQTIEDSLKDQVHGALSAVAFLLYFYESGAIQRMDPLDRAAIEVAALSIFDHTINYAVIDDKPSSYRYHHSIYLRNPMSFLLRFVDDIQEWGRVYFIVEKNRSLRICPKCRMPIVESTLSPLSTDLKQTEKNPPDIWKRGSDNKVYRGLSNRMYLCGCHKYPSVIEGSPLAHIWEQKQQQAQAGSFPPDDGFALLPDIEYRKINHVKTCLRIRFHRVQKSTFTHAKYFCDPADLLFLPNYADDISDMSMTLPVGIKRQELADLLLLHIEYDPFKALQMTLIDPSFSRYRSSELNKVRKLLRNQLHFVTLAIYANTTNNPLSLKVRILENFLNNWYTRFAKAEHLLYICRGDEYKAKDSTLLSFINEMGTDRSHDMSGVVNDLLKIYCDVYEELAAKKRELKIRGPHDVLKLRIFMLLSENPRWSLDEIEVIPRSQQAGMTIDHVRVMREKLSEIRGAVKDYTTAAQAFALYNLEDTVNALQGIVASKENGRERKQISEAEKAECRKIRETIERVRELFADANREYYALYERLVAVRYEPSKIVLMQTKGKGRPDKEKSAQNFAALLRLGYALRYNFSNENRARAFSPNTLQRDYNTLREIVVAQVAGKDIANRGIKNMDTGKHLDFYAELLVNARRFNVMGGEQEKALAKSSAKNHLVKSFAANALYGDSLRILLEDYYKQEVSQPCYMRCLKGEDVFPEGYYDTYKIKANQINAVASYCRNENYAYRTVNADMLDVHSDLYMFYCLSNI